MNPKSQSATEFIILASFMLLVIVGFFAVASSKVLEVKEGGNRQVAEDIADFAYREIETAKSVADGYTRTFVMPQTVNGINYTITIIDNRELAVNYLGYEYLKFLPANVTGNLIKGSNKISKVNGVIFIGATNETGYGLPGGNLLNCEVTTACGYTTVFKISSLSNGHAEIPSGSTYLYRVCCQKPGDVLSDSCSTGYNVLKLSAVTNAHVEKNTYTDYPIDICLSSASTSIQCTYTTQNCNDAGYDTCLATISADTNAHAADCVTDPYPTKVCCK